MRHIRDLEARFRRELKGHYQPLPGQPSPARLLHIELGLYTLEHLAPGQDVDGVPALLDGYRTAWHVLDDLPDDTDVRLANARTILWPTLRAYDWAGDLDAYLSISEEVRGYLLDLHRRPRRRACRVVADRWDWFEQALTEPLPFARNSAQTAEPGRYRMASTAAGTGIVIPADLPEHPVPALHDTTVRSRAALAVTWAELQCTARAMDQSDEAAGQPSQHWQDRLIDITLQVRHVDDAFRDDDVIRIDRMLHLVGMVSVGKSTLVLILTVWAAQHGLQVTIVVGDNSAALRAAHDLSRYPQVTAAPVMGQNRTRHTERLHRLQPPPAGRLLPLRPYGFNLVSTACGLDALRDSPTPLKVREAPCQGLIETDAEEAMDGWRRRPRRTCPLWHGCQRHEAARRLVEANVWIATPWSLIHSRLPAPTAGEQMRYLEAAWRRSDLILIDEADQVQANLDAMFASSQVLRGASDEAWIDEIIERVRQRLRDENQAPATSRQVRRFTRALDQAKTATDVIYHLLHKDRALGGAVMNWVDADYFTAWSMFDALAADWSGHADLNATDRPPGWDKSPLYRELRRQFNAFIDDPTLDAVANPPGDSIDRVGSVGSGDDLDGVPMSPVPLSSVLSGAGLTARLSGLARALLADIDEDLREENVRRLLTDLSDHEILPETKIALSDLDRNVGRLEMSVAVAVMAHRLNILMALWPEVAAELELFEAMPTEIRRPPIDLSVAVPESPMGNVLGFQYVEQQAEHSRDGQLGEFRFFRYAGVGRALLSDLPDLFPADGPGPNVLLLSGSSWAGTSPRYHIDVPVTAILRPPADKLAAIARTRFHLDIQHTGPRSTPIWVSGRYGPQRAAALRQMIAALTQPGPGPERHNRLERERATLPPGRQKIMLLVGSYAEGRAVADELLRQKASWKGQLRFLAGDDEQEAGWDDTHLLRRGDVADFGTQDAWLLVAPILAVERGHNILNDEGVAAIGAAFFLVRPHPRPKDLSYVTQRINQYALQQRAAVSGSHLAGHWPGHPAGHRMDHRADREQSTGAAAPADHQRLAAAGTRRRRQAQRRWRSLLHTLVAYSSLADDERDRLAWTQLVTIWQVVGRLLRGGQAARIYFCDAAFAPKTARLGTSRLSDNGDVERRIDPVIELGSDLGISEVIAERIDEGIDRRIDLGIDGDDHTTSLLLGMRRVLDPYFDPTTDHPDRHLVQALYQPLHRALSTLGDH